MSIRTIDRIMTIRMMLKLGHISYEEAKRQASPLIKELEKEAEVVAREFGEKPPKFNFTNLMR